MNEIKEFFINNKKISIIIIIVIVFIIIAFTYWILNNGSNKYVDYSSLIVNEIVNDNLDKNQEIKNEDEIKIHITGEVKKEGIVIINKGDRIEDAINKAGGLKEDADINKVNLAYELSDGQKVYIPSIYENNTDEYLDDSPGEGVIEEIKGKSVRKININKATLSEFTSISGIGEGTASNIIEYRNQNGLFKSIEELKNVSGIGEKKYEMIKDFITI